MPSHNHVIFQRCEAAGLLFVKLKAVATEPPVELSIWNVIQPPPVTWR